MSPEEATGWIMVTVFLAVGIAVLAVKVEVRDQGALERWFPGSRLYVYRAFRLLVAGTLFGLAAVVYFLLFS